MNDLIELLPSDLIVQHLPPEKVGGRSISNSTGISLHHKPTNTTVELDKHRSQHKNKHEALIILKDLLTEFKVGDIIVTGRSTGDLGEVKKVGKVGCHVDIEDSLLYYRFSEVAHTEEGWRYKQDKLIIKEIEDLQGDYNNSVKVLRDKLEKVREMKL